MLKKCLVLFFTFTLCFQAEAQKSFTSEPVNKQFLTDFNRCYYSQEFGFNIPDEYNCMLYDTLEKWMGTPYCYAGNSEKGIDCSGFVNVVYDRVFGLKLGARNSGDIYHKVEKIDKDDLKEGDLVFFNIRKRRISHMGVYLGNNKFVHSSTSKGVIISDLDDPYYKKYFAGAGRTHHSLVSTGPME